MKTSGILVSLVALAFGTLGISFAEEQPSTITIVTWIRGNRVVTETFGRPVASEDGSRAIEGTIQALGPEQKVRTSVTKDGRVGFSVTVGGMTALEASLGGGKASLTAAGQGKKETDTKATVVLENLVWHQYIFLLEAWDPAKGGVQKFTGFVPTQGSDFPLTVERGAEETWTVDGKPVKARRWKIVALPALTMDLWSDAAGIPLLVLVPSQDVKAVRLGYEAAAEAAAAPSSGGGPSAAKPPAYVKPGTFREVDVTVGAGEWALPGTLSLPQGEGKHPALVLVHGSGPNDRDETVGPNKPFRDLAGGLASRGIAVLRYDKRTQVHGAKMLAAIDRLTVKEETVDDAVEAVALLSRTPGIDPEKIFVLGHSLGGMLIPRIGARGPRVAGYVIMAGTARPLQEVYLEQMRYLLSLHSEITAKDREVIAEVERQNARVADPEQLASAAPDDLPLGLSAAYWKDLEGYRPAEAAKSIERPLLILQGERDYQVTMADLALWKAALGSRKDVTFRTYPKLNHLFIEGEGKPTPAEYSNAGNVSPVVVEDIATWILGPPPER